MDLIPEPAPNLRQLLAFYLEAGVDCALAEEPVDRLSEPDAPDSPRPGPRDGATPPVAGNARRDAGSSAQRNSAPAGSGHRHRARSGANGADAGSAAGAAGKFRGLRAQKHRDAAGVCRRQSASPHHVRRRSARARRGHRGPALCRTLRQIARPDDRGDRARPQQGLHRQCHSLAAARQPDANAAGDANLPAVHPAADRAREPGRAGDARQSLDANAAVDPRGHHEDPRKVVRLRHRHAHHPRHGDVPSGLSVALAVLQADVVAGPARHCEGAGADSFRHPEEPAKRASRRMGRGPHGASRRVASAPPHHEESNLRRLRPHDGPADAQQRLAAVHHPFEGARHFRHQARKTLRDLGRRRA